MLQRYLRKLLGDFSWNRPPRITRSIARIRAHRLISSATLIALLALLNGGVWGWRWYQRQPKPLRISVSAEPIPVTRLEKELHPGCLYVDFDGSVAKLEQIGKSLTSGVRVDPAVEGNWMWASDRRLSFAPKT